MYLTKSLMASAGVSGRRNTKSSWLPSVAALERFSHRGRIMAWWTWREENIEYRNVTEDQDLAHLD